MSRLAISVFPLFYTSLHHPQDFCTINQLPCFFALAGKVVFFSILLLVEAQAKGALYSMMAQSQPDQMEANRSIFSNCWYCVTRIVVVCIWGWIYTINVALPVSYMRAHFNLKLGLVDPPRPPGSVGVRTHPADRHVVLFCCVHLLHTSTLSGL